MFFIHSPVGGHLCCFHFLAIVNSTPMNISVQVCEYSFLILWGIYIEMNCWIMAFLCLTSKEQLDCFPQQLRHFVLPSVIWFLHVLTNTCYFPYLGYSHHTKCEVISFHGFDSLMTKDVEHLFLCLLAIFIFSLKKYVLKFFAHF